MNYIIEILETNDIVPIQFSYTIHFEIVST